MIEGMKVTVGGEDLADLCRSRAAHHRERASKYAEQIASMRRDALEGMQYTNGDPVMALEDRQSKHESEASEMDFIAAHIVSSETYRLGADDLIKLGITRSRY